MQEDKNIKLLLQEYGVEETSSSFNNDIMQRINAALATKQSKPLLNNFIIRLLKIAFLIVAISVISLFCFVPNLNFSFDIRNNIFNQLFTFIIVFWIGMLMNICLNKIWSKKTVLYN
ncbi:MAG: hypothetical protein ABJB05_09905 [Parafilimonas sp.]